MTLLRDSFLTRSLFMSSSYLTFSTCHLTVQAVWSIRSCLSLQRRENLFYVLLSKSAFRPSEFHSKYVENWTIISKRFLIYSSYLAHKLSDRWQKFDRMYFWIHFYVHYVLWTDMREDEYHHCQSITLKDIHLMMEAIRLSFLLIIPKEKIGALNIDTAFNSTQ